MLAILLATQKHDMRRGIVVLALLIVSAAPATADTDATIRKFARQCDQGELGACSRLVREPQISGATLATAYYIKAEVQRFYTRCMSGHIASCDEGLRRYPLMRIDDNHDARAALSEARAKHLRNQSRSGQTVARTNGTPSAATGDRGSRLVLAFVGVLAGAGLIGGFIWLAQRPPNTLAKVAEYQAASQSLATMPAPTTDIAFPITRHFPTDVRRMLRN